MSSRNRNRLISITGIAFAFLAVGIAAYLFLRQPAALPHSLLLYTNYRSPETITNWIVDTDTGEKWEVGKGLAAWRWSPSGKCLVFHTLSPLPYQIWISNFDGSNLHKVLDNKDYPDLEIKGFDWLSDEIILVNVVNKAENWGYVYAFNIRSLSFGKIGKGTFTAVSPNGKFWVQWTDRYDLAKLDGTTIPLPDYLRDFYFSPAGNKLAYSCAGKYKFSSLCVADISTSGIANERKVTEDAFVNAYGESWWSQKRKYVGFLYFSEKDKETRFRAIDVSSGTTIYDWTFPTKNARIFWSPRGDKIIDWSGLLLDLKTGQVSNFFEEIGETVPSYIVDWRMIEVP